MHTLILWVLIFSGIILGLMMMFPAPGAQSERWLQVIYMVVLALFIGSGIFRHYGGRKLKALQDMVLWAAMALLLVLVYSYRDQFAHVKDRLVAELYPHHPIINPDGSVMVRASQDGHFYLKARVNGHSVRFLVDTGASRVILTRSDAKGAGFVLDSLVYSQKTYTANGVGWGAPVLIHSLKVGDFLEENVPALVNQSGMQTSLLGLSFLNRLESYSVEGQTLTLRW